jgi:hypothetical protein
MTKQEIQKLDRDSLSALLYKTAFEAAPEAKKIAKFVRNEFKRRDSMYWRLWNMSMDGWFGGKIPELSFSRK